jgi:hypothetical protein
MPKRGGFSRLRRRDWSFRGHMPTFGSTISLGSSASYVMHHSPCRWPNRNRTRPRPSPCSRNRSGPPSGTAHRADAKQLVLGPEPRSSATRQQRMRSKSAFSAAANRTPGCCRDTTPCIASGNLLFWNIGVPSPTNLTLAGARCGPAERPRRSPMQGSAERTGPTPPSTVTSHGKVDTVCKSSVVFPDPGPTIPGPEPGEYFTIFF